MARRAKITLKSKLVQNKESVGDSISSPLVLPVIEHRLHLIFKRRANHLCNSCHICLVKSVRSLFLTLPISVRLSSFRVLGFFLASLGEGITSDVEEQNKKDRILFVLLRFRLFCLFSQAVLQCTGHFPNGQVYPQHP